MATVPSWKSAATYEQYTKWHWNEVGWFGKEILETEGSGNWSF
jgi:hypothetical protein